MVCKAKICEKSYYYNIQFRIGLNPAVGFKLPACSAALFLAGKAGTTVSVDHSGSKCTR